MFDAIHIPESGDKFCRFVATYNGANKSEFVVFSSYAQMLLVASSLAYEMNEKIDDSKEVAISNRDPISGSVFKNSGLDHVAYMICIGHTQSHEILEDKFKMARIIKGYADKGFAEITKIHGGGDDWSVIMKWVNKLK